VSLLRKRTLTLIAIAMAIILTASVFAVAQNCGRVEPEAILGAVTIMKTYDFYRVICGSGSCCEQGKYLGTVDALTCLSLCLQFDKWNTEYWVYDVATGDLVGSYVAGVCVPVCICRPSTYGRVSYTLCVKTRHPDLDGAREPSLLTAATLCLAAVMDNYVGSDYEQVYYPEGTDIVILPEPSMPEIGQNIILCQLCP
jgi:hypothetical protein